MSETQPTKTAFVLAAGGAKAAFQTAAADALISAGVRPDVMVGVSAGALVGTILSTGREATDLFCSFRFRDVYGGPWGRWRGAGTLKRVFDIVAGRRLSAYDSRIGSLLLRHYDPSDTVIPLTVLAVDLSTGSAANVTVPAHRPNMTPGEVAYYRTFVAASATVPLLAAPVAGCLVDGGVRNMAPLSQAISAGAERVFVLSNDPLTYADGPERPLDDIFDVASSVFNTFTDEIILDDIRSVQNINRLVAQASRQGATLTSRSGRPYRPVDVTIIEPPEHLGSGLDFSKKTQARRVEMGRATAGEALP